MKVRVMFPAAVLALAVAAPVLAQNKAADREKAVAHLEQTRAKFAQSISGLSEAQWKFKPAPDKWSIAEVAEHIAISEGTILGLIQNQMLKAPAPKPGETMPDDKLIAAVVDRTDKFQAPEMLKPVNKWATKDALLKDFNTARDATIAFVKTTPEDLRAHAAPHPVFKTLDTHQWVLLISAHAARHTAQIEEVKASAGYPK
jgi:hypothetical protein